MIKEITKKEIIGGHFSNGIKYFFDSSLDLQGTGITKLPDNLTVGGYLDLCETGIKELPDNLTVGGALYLQDTEIIKKTKTNLGIYNRTCHAFFWKSDVWMTLGCWLGNYKNTLKAVENKYGKDSDYARAITTMYNEMIEEFEIPQLILK